MNVPRNMQGQDITEKRLEVKYKGKNISEVLQMTVEEAMMFFENQPKFIGNLKQFWCRFGLYTFRAVRNNVIRRWGSEESSATELSNCHRWYDIHLDEPTTDLPYRAHRLIDVLQSLWTEIRLSWLNIIRCNQNRRLHNWFIIEGGDEGGTVIATGTPEDIAKCKSYTGISEESIK